MGLSLHLDLRIFLYFAAADDLQHLPVDLDAVAFEDGARVLGDGIEDSRGQCKDGRPSTRKTNTKQAGVCRWGDIVRNLR